MKYLTEAEMVNMIREKVEDYGYRGAAMKIGVRPGDVHRIATGKFGPGSAVPRAMGYEIVYRKKA